jgi:alpha-L-glutamate ligase-like protein
VIGRSLRKLCILGMNRRNFDFVQCWNPRSAYPEVDDKVRTKQLAATAGVPTPELYGVISALHELRELPDLLGDRESFVVKPARGAQGNGILVVVDRGEVGWLRANGVRVEIEDVRFRVAEILSGLFSLGGQSDRAIIEECLTVHPMLRPISYGGVPDLRVILYRGIAAMAMLRLPTRASDGRANLHQGAVGVGIDLATGRTTRAVLRGHPVDKHPDTGHDLIDLPMPHFEELLECATRLGMVSRLGYIGVDLVIDERRGPVVLELNARPGLTIQVANGRGLAPILEAIDRSWEPLSDPAKRVMRARELARGVRAGEATQ